MKIINYIVTTEGVNTNRIVPFITNIHEGAMGIHYPNYSISLNNTIGSCSGLDLLDSEFQYYQITFPYDVIKTQKFEIFTFKGYRFPLSVRVKGTKNGENFFTLIEDSGPFCTKEDEGQHCGEGSYKTFNIPLDKYKGFKIEMNETDSKGTHQLCVGRIEIYGDFFFVCSIYLQKLNFLQLYISIFIPTLL